MHEVNMYCIKMLQCFFSNNHNDIIEIKIYLITNNQGDSMKEH